MMLPIAETSDAVYRIVGYAALPIIVAVPILIIWITRAGPRRLRRIMKEVAQGASPQERPVRVQFHAYHGFLVFFSQTPIDVTLPATSARLLLNRLLKFNLTWGFFAAGAVFIPVLSFLEYRSQMQSIERQEKGAFPVQTKSDKKA